MDSLRRPKNFGRPLSERELAELVSTDLPGWFEATAATDADSILLHETAFGTSPHELLLFAAAIKYATAKGKHVHIIGRFEETNGQGKKLAANGQRARVARVAPDQPSRLPGRRTKRRREL